MRACLYFHTFSCIHKHNANPPSSCILHILPHMLTYLKYIYVNIHLCMYVYSPILPSHSCFQFLNAYMCTLPHTLYMHTLPYAYELSHLIICVLSHLCISKHIRLLNPDADTTCTYIRIQSLKIICTQPLVYSQARTPLVYSQARTPLVYSQAHTPLVYSQAHTPLVYSQAHTLTDSRRWRPSMHARTHKHAHTRTYISTTHASTHSRRWHTHEHIKHTHTHSHHIHVLMPNSNIQIFHTHV